MKPNTTTQQWLAAAITGLALAFSTSSGPAAIPDISLGTFDTAITGGPEWSRSWGVAAPSFDATQDNTGNGGGSCYISGTYGTNDQNTINVSGCVEGNPWWNPTGMNFNFTDFTNLEFDVKWNTDPTNAVSLATFNSNPGGGEAGFQFWAVDYPSFNLRPVLGTVQIPTAATNGWAHVSFTINPVIAGIDPSKGIMIKKWISSTAAKANLNATFGFWIDNVVLKGRAAPLPPPTVSLDTPVPGLAFVAASTGQYDRQEIRTVGTNCSWIGASGPVSYSVDVAKVGVNSPSGFLLFMHLVPGIAGSSAGSDYAERNVLFWRLQNDASGGVYSDIFYKTNSPNSNGTMFNNGLGGVWNSTPKGTWTLTFSNDSSFSITAPSGATMTTNLPQDVVSIFSSAGPGMQINVGGVPNNNSRIGQMAVVTGVRITGTPRQADISSSFINQAVDTNVWKTIASNTNCVRVIPTDAAWWLNWTLPANAFSLQQKATLDPGMWDDAPMTGYSAGAMHYSLLSQASTPGAGSGYFRLIKRAATRLLVLLPGQTNAPNTATGRGGQIVVQTNTTPFTVKVLSVDDTFHPVANSTDSVGLTCSGADLGLGIVVQPSVKLNNGVATFTDGVTLYASDLTLTATNSTTPTWTPNTSDPIPTIPPQ